MSLQLLRGGILACIGPLIYVLAGFWDGEYVNQLMCSIMLVLRAFFNIYCLYPQMHSQGLNTCNYDLRYY